MNLLKLSKCIILPGCDARYTASYTFDNTIIIKVNGTSITPPGEEIPLSGPSKLKGLYALDNESFALVFGGFVIVYNAYANRARKYSSISANVTDMFLSCNRLFFRIHAKRNYWIEGISQDTKTPAWRCGITGPRIPIDHGSDMDKGRNELIAKLSRSSSGMRMDQFGNLCIRERDIDKLSPDATFISFKDRIEVPPNMEDAAGVIFGRRVSNGLYRVTWSGGGDSLAAVSQTQTGIKLISPVNWTEVGVSLHAVLKNISVLELISS